MNRKTVHIHIIMNSNCNRTNNKFKNVFKAKMMTQNTEMSKCLTTTSKFNADNKTTGTRDFTS